MKVFAVLFVLMTSLAQAAEIKVMETSVDSFLPHAEASWAINKEMGRAWVELKTFDHLGGRGSTPVWQRQKVEGLVFDTTSSMITFTHEGQVFECASVSTRWYGNVVRKKDCSLVVKQTKVSYDDGYHSGKRLVHQVFIVTK